MDCKSITPGSNPGATSNAQETAAQGPGLLRRLARLLFPAAMAWLCLAAAYLLSWLRPESNVVPGALLLLMLAFGLLSAWRIPAILRKQASRRVLTLAALFASSPLAFFLAVVVAGILMGTWRF